MKEKLLIILVLCNDSLSSIYTKRSEILYIFFVALCKVNPAACLHDVKFGSIDFFVLVADCFRFPFLSCFLLFPNRSWLRSLGSAWGLGERTARMKRFLAIVTNIKKQENSIKPLQYVYAYSSATLWSFLNAVRKAYSKNSRMVLVYRLP